VQLFFSLGNVDVCILKRIHLNINVGKVANLGLQKSEDLGNFVLLIERNEIDQFLRSGVVALFNVNNCALPKNNIFDEAFLSCELSKSFLTLGLWLK
jgi:hypothetical protein